MRTLETKGYLKHVEKDRMYIYSPTITREQVRQGLLGDMVERLFDGSPMFLLNSLVEKKSSSETEMKQIRQIRDQILKKNRKGGKKST